MQDESHGKPNNYIDLITQTLRSNDNFVRSHAEEAYTEVIELIMDAIDYLRVTDQDVEEAIKPASFYFGFHVLLPISNAIYLDMLAGNIPACFMQLRIVLETLVKCHFADAKYPNEEFFQDRLQMLEKENLPISKIMKDMDTELGVGNRFIAMWGKLSREWAHGGGSMERVVKEIEVQGSVPTWALVIPSPYVVEDLGSLEELRKWLSEFRELFAAALGYQS